MDHYRYGEASAEDRFRVCAQNRVVAVPESAALVPIVRPAALRACAALVLGSP